MSRRRQPVRATPAIILWTLFLFMFVAEILPVIMRDCASLSWK